MPYPREFKQSTLVSVNDGRGNIVGNLPAQVFKPLLGCEFNGPQVQIVGHSIPRKAGIVLRALVLCPGGGPLDIKPGPQYWLANAVPSLVLSEDPNAESWWWTDAVPWAYAGGTLWSIFAAKDGAVSPPPPPPPPPATPVVLGTTMGTATPLSLGVPYSAILPVAGTGYGYVPVPTGTGYTLNVTGDSNGSLSSAVSGGNHLGATVGEGGPLVSLGNIVVPGGTHTGPEMIYIATNAGPTPDAILFGITSP